MFGSYDEYRTLVVRIAYDLCLESELWWWNHEHWRVRKWVKKANQHLFSYVAAKEVSLKFNVLLTDTFFHIAYTSEMMHKESFLWSERERDWGYEYLPFPTDTIHNHTRLLDIFQTIEKYGYRYIYKPKYVWVYGKGFTEDERHLRREICRMESRFDERIYGR